MLNEQEKATLMKILEEMQQIGIFSGTFDAKHGSWEFMHGVGTAMTYLAEQISEEYRYNFEEKFFGNFNKSVDKAEEGLL